MLILNQQPTNGYTTRYHWDAICASQNDSLHNTYARSEYHTQLAKMGFDKMFDLTAGVYFNLYNTPE